MNITPQEAQQALDDIRSTTSKAHSFFNNWAHYMLLWGIVWTIGFLATQVQPRFIDLIWSTMIVGGMVGSAIMGSRQGAQMRTTPGSHMAFVSSRLGIFYGVLYAFAILWLIIFPLSSIQIGMLWITVVMFGSIIAGVWLHVQLSIWLGIGVTLASVLGYYLFPSYFWLWSAIFAGLPLIAVSMYYFRKR